MAKNKTPEQVSEWLRTRPWIKEFARTMRDNHVKKADATKILSGFYGHNTIAVAFGWDDSPQGLKYWHKKDKELRDWYHGDNKTT